MIHIKNIKKITILIVLILAVGLSACNTADMLPNGNFGTDALQNQNLDSLPESEKPSVENETPPAQEEIEGIKKEEYILAKASLNIRSKASTTGKIMGKMDKNDMLLYLGRQGNWYITIYKDKTAYVSSLYSKLVEIEKTDDIIERVLSIGYPLLGYPYVWGSERYHWGNGILNTNYVHGKYDCSALVQCLYYIGAGIKLGLTTREQIKQGNTVDKNDIARGDLLFFTNSSRSHLSGIERVGHVAMYLGDNYILHTASDFAVIEPITAKRWSYYIKAKRFV